MLKLSTLWCLLSWAVLQAIVLLDLLQQITQMLTRQLFSFREVNIKEGQYLQVV